MAREGTGFPSFSSMLRSALGGLLDPSASDFADMMADDGVMEWPFAPPGYPSRIEGRQALAAYLVDLGSVLAIDRISEPEVYLMGDSGPVILQFECEGRGLKSDRPYHQRYVSIITMENGKIARYRDYWNPLHLLEAVDRNDDLVASLGKYR